MTTIIWHLSPNQRSLKIEFVVDTGFGGALTLSVAAVEALGLPYFQSYEAVLADGSTQDAYAYAATIFVAG